MALSEINWPHFTAIYLVTMFTILVLYLGFAKANGPWAFVIFGSFRNYLIPLYFYVSGNNVYYSCFVGFAKANGPWAWVIWWPEGQVWLLISWQGLHALPVKSARRSWRCRHRRTTKSKAYLHITIGRFFIVVFLVFRAKIIKTRENASIMLFLSSQPVNHKDAAPGEWQKVRHTYLHIKVEIV